MNSRRLLSYTRQAIDDYHLIEDQDRIAVGLSGGKDSLTLMYALKNLQRFYPKHFQLTAITVDLGFKGFHPQAMQTFCETLEVPFKLVKTQISEIVFGNGSNHPCSLCAKLRKGAFNQAALDNGCNKIAYAHHRDDLIETMLLSLFYEGRFHTFSPKTYLERTGLTLIRPLIYAPEADIKGFQNKYKLPVTVNPCPADGNTKRAYVKQLLATLNQDNPGIKERLFNAIQSSEFSVCPNQAMK